LIRNPQLQIKSNVSLPTLPKAWGMEHEARSCVAESEIEGVM
jgi:hypothetical protein